MMAIITMVEKDFVLQCMMGVAGCCSEHILRTPGLLPELIRTANRLRVA